jgi:hypothetical protein
MSDWMDAYVAWYTDAIRTGETQVNDAFRAGFLAGRENPAVAGAETFREFYRRTTGCPFPGVTGEYWSDIQRRIAEVMADWCDRLAARGGKS